VSLRVTGVVQPSGRFVGREQDLAALRRALASGKRAVVLHGGPGVGKTRLAIEVADSLDVTRVFVPARDARSGEDLTAAILGALELRHEPGQAIMTEIVRVVGNAPSVIVLDDLDAFKGVEGALHRLLDGWTNAQLLITGRRSIPLPTAAVHRVDPLPRPRGDDLDPVTMANQPAVALFCDQATEIDPAFRLDARTAATIASICRHTDGIPLAIELTASRLAVMSPEALLAELDRNSVLGLVGGALRESIERSWALLTTDQEVLLASMSVLTAPSSLETIQAVSGRDRTSSTSATIDDLTQLVDLHLVNPDLTTTDGARFGLSSSVATFARERLERSGRTREALMRLVHVTMSRARAEAAFAVSLDVAPSDGLLAEFDNIRLAVETAIASEDVARAEVVQFVVDVAPHFFARGEVRSLSSHLTTVLDARSEDLSPALRAVSLAWLGRCESEHTFPPDREASTRRLREALDVCSRIDEPQVRLDVLATVAEMLPYLTDPSVAATAASQGLQLATEIGDDARRGRFLSLSGVIAHNTGSPQEGARFAVQAIAAGMRCGDDALVVRGSLVLRGIEREHRPSDAPEISMPHIVELARRVGDERLELWALAALGVDQIETGDARGAATTIVALLALAEPLDYMPSRRHALTLAAMLAAMRGDHGDAARFLGSLSLATAVVTGAMAPNAMVRHAGMIDQIRSSLGDDRFREAMASGAALAWPDAINAAHRYANALLEDTSTARLPMSSTVSRGPDSLTGREREVLRLLATGATNKTIAAELGLRPKTVMHHNESIYRKLRVRGRAAAVSVAMRSGLLDEPR
jgi:predicted ATPase/DNA-binding CsgD family transcriptional regulator